MECSLAALIACFSWSNLYIDTSLSYLDVTQEYVVRDERRVEYLSPYGGLALGLTVPFKDIQFSLEATHISSVATNHDRGINSISIHARWFPFR
jgi:hypothetical protein